MDHNKSVPWTEADFKEISSDGALQDAFGQERAEEFEQFLRDSFTVKFPNYITDGPGYANELFVLVGGIPNAVVLGRRKGGGFFIDDNS